MTGDSMKCPECGHHPIKFEIDRFRPYGSPTERNEWCPRCDWGQSVNLDQERAETLALAENTAGELVPGGFADVELVLARQESAILVPAEAVIPEQSGHRVFLVRNGKAAPTSVKIGLRTRERVQIIEGLSLGDSVVVAGVLLARPGSPVRVSETVE